jgi:hypothetical protein
MNCKKIKLVEKYINGDLVNKRIIEKIKQHILSCKECQEWIKLNNCLNSWGDLIEKYKSPDYFTQKVLSNLSETYYKESINSLSFWRWSFTATVVVVLVLLIYIVKYKQTTVKVEFYFVPNTQVQTVSIVGDFNHWDINKNKLKKHGDKWVAKLSLKPGRYYYMFVINGKYWVEDPYAEEYVEDGFGNKNSVIDTFLMYPKKELIKT